MRLAAWIAFGASLLAACATVPAPQDRAVVSPGQRVRITLTNRVATGPLQGTVVSLSPDTIVVAREEGGERRLGRSQVREVEVSVTRERDPVKAAGYGILVATPLLIPLVLLAPLVLSESGASSAEAIGIILVPVAFAATAGAVIGGGPQDAWVPAIWEAPSSWPADSVPSESREDADQSPSTVPYG